MDHLTKSDTDVAERNGHREHLYAYVGERRESEQPAIYPTIDRDGRFVFEPGPTPRPSRWRLTLSLLILVATVAALAVLVCQHWSQLP